MMSCEQHDYIEIACLYRYAVTLTLTSGTTLSGIALDTARDQLRQECIKILADGTEQLIPLADISRMTVNTDNPHFRIVDFD